MSTNILSRAKWTKGDIVAFFFFQAEDGIRDYKVTGVQTCALPIFGVAAGVGIVLFLLVVRRAPWQRAALAGTPVFVAALGWGLWVARHRGGIDPGMATNYGSYFEVLKGAGLGVFWPSLRELPRPLGDLTLSWLPAAGLYYALAVATLAVLLYGLALMVRRSSIGLTLLCYLAILAVWPFPVDRFVWGMLPWLGLGWFPGVP